MSSRTSLLRIAAGALALGVAFGSPASADPAEQVAAAQAAAAMMADSAAAEAEALAAEAGACPRDADCTTSNVSCRMPIVVGYMATPNQGYVVGELYQNDVAFGQGVCNDLNGSYFTTRLVVELHYWDWAQYRYLPIPGCTKTYHGESVGGPTTGSVAVTGTARPELEAQAGEVPVPVRVEPPLTCSFSQTNPYLRKPHIAVATQTAYDAWGNVVSDPMRSNTAPWGG